MTLWFLVLMVAAVLGSVTPRAESSLTSNSSAPKRVVVLPIRDDIMPPMVYLVRRGVKVAMDNNADLLVIDMNTNGGRVDSTEKIMEIIGQFKGETVTYVNKSAYSAGAFIAVATRHIYMAPESVIGAAAPIMLAPGGTGVEAMPETLEIKTTSALSAKIRAYAQKNGHNPDVVEAMIDKQKELVIDGQVVNPKGRILTLTNIEAERRHGDPPRPLLSAGTVETLEVLLEKLAGKNASKMVIQPTGAEKLATLINSLSWLWLMIGIAGIYLEFKTPGFGLPGIVGILAFALYFLGSYVAGLSGLEWPALFLVGLVLVALELFLFPGTVLLGLTGAVLMIVTIVMAMVDIYPGGPVWPNLAQLKLPLRNLGLAVVGSVITLLLLSRVLPKTPIYGVLVSQSASGVQSVMADTQTQAQRIGLEGVAVSVLRPGGKAMFGDQILDVITQGEMLPKGTRVRIIGHSGREAVVEPIEPILPPSS